MEFTALSHIITFGKTPAKWFLNITGPLTPQTAREQRAAGESTILKETEQPAEVSGHK